MWSHATVTWPFQRGTEFRKRRFLYGHERQPGPVEQRAPDLERRRIEGDRRRMQHHIVRRQRCERRLLHQSDDAAMDDGNGLRCAGGARRT